MKAGLLIIILAGTFSVAAQTPFEGTIVYNLKAHSDKDTALLTVAFRPGGLRISFQENSRGSDKIYTLVNLDSGKVFLVDPIAKTFRSRRLISNEPIAGAPATKTVLGHKATAQRNTEKSLSGVMGILSGRSVFYVADDLYFPVAEKWANNFELAIVRDNRIVLSAELYTSSLGFLFEDWDSDGPGTVMEPAEAILEAASIIPSTQNASDFVVPAGFTRLSRNSHSGTVHAADSASAVMADGVYDARLDSFAVVPAAPPYPPNTPTPKKKAAAKSPAQRRKS